jgi:hypothetical protein
MFHDFMIFSLVSQQIVLFAGILLPSLALTGFSRTGAKERQNNTKVNHSLEIFKPASRN